ncbi:MAG: MC/SLC25 family protein [Candidatus Babeliales bacterium]
MLQGLLSGGTIVLTTQPFMVLITKLYANLKKEKYKHGFDAAYKILRNEGVRGFYKGCGYRAMGIIAALPVINASRDFFNKRIS